MKLPSKHDIETARRGHIIEATVWVCACVILGPLTAYALDHGATVIGMITGCLFAIAAVGFSLSVKCANHCQEIIDELWPSK